MKKNKLVTDILLMIVGIVLLAVGLLVVDESAKNIGGFCIGVGAALGAIHLGKLVLYPYYKKHPDLERQSQIEAKDERNVSINDKAKSKAFDFTIKLLVAVPFLLILLDAPLWMTLTAVGFYLLPYGMQVYYMVKYNSEM